MLYRAWLDTFRGRVLWWICQRSVLRQHPNVLASVDIRRRNRWSSRHNSQVGGVGVLRGQDLVYQGVLFTVAGRKIIFPASVQRIGGHLKKEVFTVVHENDRGRFSRAEIPHVKRAIAVRNEFTRWCSLNTTSMTRVLVLLGFSQRVMTREY